MKMLWGAVLACVVGGVLISSYGQCNDAFDNVLCVYPHPDGDNATRDIRDGQISSFWNNWGSKDYVSMVPPADCFPGRCGFNGGASDASIEIKALANGYGLYILSVVTDNTWTDPPAPGAWQYDAIDFYFDAYDANYIFTCPDCRIPGYCALCTYNTQQFQVYMGATSVPRQCQYAAYDDDVWALMISHPTWDELESEFGIRLEVLQLGPTQKAQEWFFPWESYGKKGSIPAGTLLDGMKVAFSGGYNDMDGDEAGPEGVSCLRWRVRDPWDGSENSWGDFLIQPGVGNVRSVGTKPSKSASVRAHAPASSNVQYFTLQGKKIGASDVRGAATRAVLVSGTVDAKARVTVLGR